MRLHAKSFSRAAATISILACLVLNTSRAESSRSRHTTPPDSILRFNRKLADATRHMDNAAMLALWADDGVSLLPDASPLLGKPAIAAFMNRVTASLKGATMAKFAMQCSGIEVSGNLASEWCTEHQIVTLPGNQPPFDGHGQMLLVLRRDTQGDWRLLREMWNQAPKTDSH